MEGRTEHDARAQSGDIEGADSGSEVLDGLIELFRAQNNGADPTETHLKKWAETIREMTVSSGGSVSPSLDASPSHDKAESPSKQTSAPPISTTTTTKPENGQKDAPKQSKVSPRKTKRRVYSRASFKRIKLDVPPIITRLRQQATDGTNHAIFTQMQQHVLELDKIAGMVSKVLLLNATSFYWHCEFAFLIIDHGFGAGTKRFNSSLPRQHRTSSIPEHFRTTDLPTNATEDIRVRGNDCPH